MARPTTLTVIYEGVEMTVPEAIKVSGQNRYRVYAAAKRSRDVTAALRETQARVSATETRRLQSASSGLSMKTLSGRARAGRVGDELTLPPCRGKRAEARLAKVIFRGELRTIQQVADEVGCSRASVERAKALSHDVTEYVERSAVRTTDQNVFTDEWIWSRISPEPNSGCWLWTRGEMTFGYGWFAYGEYGRGAHKAFYQRFKGPVPEGMVVMHKCDVPQCCNPDHLALGTRLDNIADCAAKGRNVHGEMSPKAKLSDEMVRQAFSLRSSGATQQEIADECGTSRELIRDVLNRKKWKHVIVPAHGLTMTDISDEE